MSQLWQRCVHKLESELTDTDLNTWIRPLQCIENNSSINIMAPNRFVKDKVAEQFLDRISQIMTEECGDARKKIHIDIGSQPGLMGVSDVPELDRRSKPRMADERPPHKETNLNPNFTFSNFVEGKANQLARASARQVADHPGQEFSNPMFLYGGVGLGKTHLMHAIGNEILRKNPQARVLYLHSERFVADMVSALQHNAFERFKRYYRSLNALLIDDIQFFAGKDRSQEEFFHTFNALLEGQQQIILTSDRYPKEVEGLEERLKSRFGWGLTAELKSPELETRVAILQSKSQEHFDTELPADIAFFIAKHIRSNIRELEGALRRVMAGARFMGREITLDYVKETLQDLLALHDRMITIENIQKTVAEYYKLRVADLLSKKRSRSIARPRQLAMALAKDLTQHSLPEIGDAFGGRDHTTVLHATRKIADLKTENNRIREDYENLSSRLTS